MLTSTNPNDMSQPFHPIFINLPQPPSHPDTPSEMPGTPTSTTTSLSALSTTAIKDGHRGHGPSNGPSQRGSSGHHHHPSTTSLEAERADRISRLAGLGSVQQSRPPAQSHIHGGSTTAQTTTPTAASSGTYPAAYFDARGQPRVESKMSTVGTASATEGTGSVSTALGDGDGDLDVDMDMAEDDGELSMDTSFRDEEEMGSYRDEEMMATRSVGGFEDRMSDDGTGSLVGFGEGAGSTVSGPIYQRRLGPGQQQQAMVGQGQNVGSSSAGAMAGHAVGLERRMSGLSEGAGSSGPGARRETVVRGQQPNLADIPGATDTPVSATAAMERREARMMDGVATDGLPARPVLINPRDEDVFVDTTTRGPVPVVSAIRETQQPHSHQQQPQAQYPGSTSREAAERMMREALRDGEVGKRDPVLRSPETEGRLGTFYFEERK